MISSRKRVSSVRCDLGALRRSGDRRLMHEAWEGTGEEFEVSPGRAAEIVAFAATLTGWDDGPEHARHPLLIDDSPA